MKTTKNSTGQNLWKNANKIIPGGNGLLSKRPERYVPDLWPIYFSKAKGAFIWDLDGNKFIDMAQNGIGSAILGYADKDVDNAVIKSIKNGINTTLNPPEEVELADLLLKLNPCMDMVKFARGGGEAMSIAIRIARARSGNQKILFSGYHGWTDWYIAANVSRKSNLDDHLIPGLSPIGVPKSLANTSIPFFYDDTEDFLKKINQNKDIAAVVIEGARYSSPNKVFLKTIARECKKRNIIFIVDEITSGFRICNSGTYIKYNYQPDIVVYGKALGNGYAISAIVGKQHVMEYASLSFISSTMWTERVGFSAAIACLKKIKNLNLHEHLVNIGKKISIIWIKNAKKFRLKIKVSNFYPLVTFKMDYPGEENKILTLFSQEMLKRGFLASNSVYVTAAHNEIILKKYNLACEESFKTISLALQFNINNYLESRIRFDSFSRLNK